MGKPIGPERKPLDMVLLLDGTGSMTPWLRELRRQWPALLRELNALSSFRLGAVVFRDHHDGADGDDDAEHVTWASEPSYLLSDTTRFLDAELNLGGVWGGRKTGRLRVVGAPRGAEALECGLRTVAELPWRTRARKLVVLVGDRPPHAGACSRGVDWRDEVERLAADGVEVCTVRVGDCLEAQRCFDYVAARTGGRFLDQPHIRALPPALIGLARRTAAGLGRSQALLRV